MNSMRTAVVIAEKSYRSTKIAGPFGAKATQSDSHQIQIERFYAVSDHRQAN